MTDQDPQPPQVQPTADRPPDPPTGPEDLLIKLVEMRDEPCPVCGYSLKGLTSTTCPECAADLDLRVGSDQVRVGPWAMALVSCAMALGFDGVTALLFIIAIIRAPTNAWQPYALLSVFVILGLLTVGGMVLLARRRHRWMRMPRRQQWVVAWTVFAAVGLFHLLVGVSLIWWLS